MKKILLGMFICAILVSVNVTAKEYLGFDLGHDSLDKVLTDFKKKDISYSIDYEKDINNEYIKELPIITIQKYPLWAKYGKVVYGQFYFSDGNLVTLYVAWHDKGDNMLDVT